MYQNIYRYIHPFNKTSTFLSMQHTSSHTHSFIRGQPLTPPHPHPHPPTKPTHTIVSIEPPPTQQKPLLGSTCADMKSFFSNFAIDEPLYIYLEAMQDNIYENVPYTIGGTGGDRAATIGRHTLSYMQTRHPSIHSTPPLPC